MASSYRGAVSSFCSQQRTPFHRNDETGSWQTLLMWEETNMSESLRPFLLPRNRLDFLTLLLASPNSSVWSPPVHKHQLHPWKEKKSAFTYNPVNAPLFILLLFKETVTSHYFLTLVSFQTCLSDLWNAVRDDLYLMSSSCFLNTNICMVPSGNILKLNRLSQTHSLSLHGKEQLGCTTKFHFVLQVSHMGMEWHFSKWWQHFRFWLKYSSPGRKVMTTKCCAPTRTHKQA